jgi:thiamine pyrophosphokinase
VTGPSDEIVVVAGGNLPPPPRLRAQLPANPAFVVAADSGLAAAEALGLRVDVVVGDMDSVDPHALASAQARGVDVDRHREDKDKTDLELALDVALAKGGPGGRYVVVTSVGGRLDHALANVMLLGSPSYAPAALEAFVDAWHVTVVRGRTRLPARAGGLVTLLPVGGDAVAVVTEHLRFPLRRETLAVGTSRGVSNVAEQDEVVVGLDAGVLLVLREWADSTT